eukprot:TRINITY_DN21919_c0_g1_i1.p1 TRINITY_DN21919_c0_g1~~TRINITY_DN21919_c0_g1_i1.p1  ORF type:complete len:272 (-),score=58.79 TRINITY_DN21919_c0_g1_i1:133-948(-)
MAKCIDRFKPVFGEAKAELERAGPHALLPFLYHAHPLSQENALLLQVSDFHANTWQLVITVAQLEDLRDEVGIGGSWNDFLDYFEAAFSSNSVRVVLGGPASSIGGKGASSAKIIAQKSKGMPHISIPLERLTDDTASDAMGNISFELFKSFKQKSEALITEVGKVSQLMAALANEKNNVEALRKQLDSFSFGNKRRGQKVMASQSVPASAPNTYDMQQSQLDEKTCSHIDHPDTRESHSLTKGPTKSRVRVAPVSRRAKHRGIQLADGGE